MKKLLNDQLRPSKGVTLIELSLIIAVLLILISASTLSVTAYQNWKKGLEAGETLKAVYQAQKLYLADKPTTTSGELTWEKISSYHPNAKPGVVLTKPQVVDLDGGKHDISFDVMPPTSAYGDPTGPGDSLWDAGK